MEEVAAFLQKVEPQKRREEAAVLDTLFRETTGWKPTLWQGGMIGYGVYDYIYKSGRKGSYFATGFAPRKAKLTVYIMPGYSNFDAILKRFGKHSIGKSCLYINKLQDIDTDVLAELIRAGLEDLSTYWPVRAS